MFRFILYAIVACIAAFGGVSLAMRGFFNSGKAFEMAVNLPLVGPATLHTTMAASFAGQGGKDYERRMWEAERTMQGDNDPKLDGIRMEALQTANAYAMAPCGEYTKLNLVAALTAYTRAWQARMDCPRLMDVPVCGDKKLKEIAATFSTPLDLRAQAALAEALQQGGIMKADFPAEVRRDVSQFSGPALWFDGSPTCAPRQRNSAGSWR
jgi:hypothetical protein